MVEIFKHEWNDWKTHKVTREFLERLFQKREQLKEGMAEGQVSGMEQERIVGQCQAFKDAIDYGIYSFEVLDSEETE